LSSKLIDFTWLALVGDAEHHSELSVFGESAGKDTVVHDTTTGMDTNLSREAKLKN
jgi:hypothetical protein